MNSGSYWFTVSVGASRTPTALRVIAYNEWLKGPIGRRIYGTVLQRVLHRRRNPWAFIRRGGRGPRSNA